MKCPIEGCQEKAPPRGLMCPVHWCLVDARLKAQVRDLFDPAKAPEEQAVAYLNGAREALANARKADELVRAVPKLKAISLHRPWGWLLASGKKPVENRDRPPYESLVGQRIALHSALKIDKEGAAAVRQEFGIELPADAWATGIVAVATLDRYFSPADTAEPLLESPWYSGRYGWVFRDVVPVLAVECSGQQGFWDVPADVARRVWYRRAVELAMRAK